VDRRRLGRPLRASLRLRGYRLRAEPEDVAAVRAGADLLGGYYDAVHARTIDYLHTVTEADLPRIVDTSWDPPVTLRCGWSASSRTTCSTLARPPTFAGWRFVPGSEPPSH